FRSQDTFADRHETMRKGKESTRDIIRLMKLQERLNGPTEEEMGLGGLVKTGLSAAATALGGPAAGAAVGAALKYGPALLNIGRGALGKAEGLPVRTVDDSAIRSLQRSDVDINVD